MRGGKREPKQCLSVRPPAGAAALALACALGFSCAARPHALDYVVLEDHPAPPASRITRQLEAAAEMDEDDYPIYREAMSAGSGGSPCGVGLIGTECERGLLEDETPLHQTPWLGPEGLVIEEWSLLNSPSARRRDEGQVPPRRGARARR